MFRSFAVLTLILCACGKETPSGSAAPAPPASSASARTTVDAAPNVTADSAAPNGDAGATGATDTPTPPKCPPGFVANAFPAYCIKVPISYTLRASQISQKTGSLTYNTGASSDTLTIAYDESPIAVAAKNVEAEMKFGPNKLERKGELPGGNKWFQGSHDEYARVITLIKAGSLTLKCSFGYKTKKPPPQEAVGACRSLRVPAP